MGYPTFVESGMITSEGVKLVEWVEAQFAAYDKPGTDANIAALNALAGPIAEYYTIVHKMKQYTPAKWCEAFPNSARNAYDIMKYVEEQAAKEAQQAAAIAETASKSDALEAELAKLKETLETTIAKLEAANAALLTENEALKSKATEPAKRKGKSKVEATPEPVETEDETESSEDNTSEGE